VKTVTSTAIENTLVLTEASTDCQTEAKLTGAKPWVKIWGVFSSTFVTILMAEMGDKTQLATMLMSAESRSPWVVFAGAGAALVSTSLVGVLLGRWLSKHITPKTLNLLGGILLVSISIMLFWDVFTNS
jgi:Ca2+/H+ antiporter, TMEM165/GDT1 family